MKKLMAVFVAVATLGVYGFASAHPDITLTVVNSNDARVTNTLSAFSTTGGNLITADQDVEDGEITTGNAESNGEISNDLNQNGADVTVADGSDVVIDLDNDNYAEVTNEEILIADSGTNEISADQDVQGGSIMTGNAKARGIIGSVNGINLNFALFAIGTSPTNEVDDVTIEMENDNDARLGNVVLPVAGTGENLITADQDVGSGSGASIDTGDAEATGEVYNDVNQNQAEGDINASSDASVDVDNDNYDEETNTVTPLADTGTNEISASEDVSGSTISTGIAKTILKVFNRKNISIVNFSF